MVRYLSKSILLLAFTVALCCVVYPLLLWVIGQAAFPSQANGSLVRGPGGALVGSRLIAQPFTKDEYFWPRPSAASYDATSSASSSLAASNYALRDRVARTLGPIVKYRGGPKACELVAPDVESWFKQDMFQGKPHLVAQWADLHNSLAQAWVKADPAHATYLEEWAKKHPDVIAKFIKETPGTPQPKPEDLSVVFFEEFSKDNPGQFPSVLTRTGPDGKPETVLEPVSQGADIQSIFFDMWRQDHPGADLQDVPGDMVTTSGSGLDPHITLENAEYQLDRVSSAWADTDTTKRNSAEIRKEIEELLRKNASAPWFGLAGEKVINVLEVNLDLQKRYGKL